MSFCCCLLQGGSFVNTSTFKLWKFTWGCQGQRRSCFCGKLKGFWLQFSICRDAYNLIIQLLNSMPRTKILGKWDLKKKRIFATEFLDFTYFLFLVGGDCWSQHERTLIFTKYPGSSCRFVGRIICFNIGILSNTGALFNDFPRMIKTRCRFFLIIWKPFITIFF